MNMIREERPDDVEYVEPEIPAALRERLDDLFVDFRGYEPTTLQESLSVVCDLAEAQLSADRDASDETLEPIADLLDDARTEQSTQETDTEPDEEWPALGTAPHRVIDAVDTVFPEGWDEDPVAKRTLPAVVDEYDSALDSDAATPEQVAIERVATRRAETPASLRETLVDSLYGSEDVPEEMREEFYSEALDVASDHLEETRSANSETDSDETPELAELDVDLTDHDGLSAETTFDDTPMEAAEIVSPSKDVSFDELVEELDDGDNSVPTPSSGPQVESLVETANTDSRVREVADEVLDDITGDMFDQLENGVDQGLAGVADGMGATGTMAGGDTLAANGGGESDSAPVPTPPPSPSTANDSVPGPLVADPETDCDDCGDTYRVSMLDTTIRDGDQSVVLLCSDCQH
jgi:hypothetical protein